MATLHNENGAFYWSEPKVLTTSAEGIGTVEKWQLKTTEAHEKFLIHRMKQTESGRRAYQLSPYGIPWKILNIGPRPSAVQPPSPIYIPKTTLVVDPPKYE
jgi:hypothetical protein